VQEHLDAHVGPLAQPPLKRGIAGERRAAPVIGDDQHGKVAGAQMARQPLGQGIDLALETRADIMDRGQQPLARRIRGGRCCHAGNARDPFRGGAKAPLRRRPVNRPDGRSQLRACRNCRQNATGFPPFATGRKPLSLRRRLIVYRQD
jgi:hypothetical protein